MFKISCKSCNRINAILNPITTLCSSCTLMEEANKQPIRISKKIAASPSLENAMTSIIDDHDLALSPSIHDAPARQSASKPKIGKEKIVKKTMFLKF